MSTNLRGIGEKARLKPKLVFTSLYHHVTDIDNLRVCYEALGGKKAVGVDGVTKEEYGNVLRKGEMLRRAKVRVNGHLNYYAITDNTKACNTYRYHVIRILRKWLNRKSQRTTYTWQGYLQALEWVGWPSMTIRKDLNPFRRAEAP